MTVVTNIPLSLAMMNMNAVTATAKIMARYYDNNSGRYHPGPYLSNSFSELMEELISESSS